MKMKWEWTGKEATLEDVQTCVGQGWHGIIERLVKDLFKLGWDGQVAQVKEKFGGLRFYIGGATTAVHDRISEAEKECDKTCEWCGQPGKIDEVNKSWWLTLCPACVVKRTKMKEEEAAKYKRRNELEEKHKPVLNSFRGTYSSFPSFDSVRFEFPGSDDTMIIKVYLKYDAPNVYPEAFEGFKVDRYVCHLTPYRLRYM